MQTVLGNHHTGSFGLRPRLVAAGIHLAASVALAALCALLVFALWFPYPFRELSGGRDLFMLVVSVDVVIGPLITFAVFNLAKPRRELRRDLFVVALLQLGALAYGLWTVQLARPVHVVFEYDSFRVVHRVDVPADLEGKAPAGVEVAPLTGPTVLALRQFASPQEKFDMTVQALQGVQLAARPDLWRPYASERTFVLGAAKPIPALLARFPQRKAEIEAAVRATGKPTDKLVYLPLIGRKVAAWTVLLDSTSADIVGYLPLDPF